MESSVRVVAPEATISEIMTLTSSARPARASLGAHRALVGVALLRLLLVLAALAAQLPAGAYLWARVTRSSPQQFNHSIASAAVAPSSKSAPAQATPNRPHWQRPGCYQVGHTRTISIPGCVKFNLSTNACRGFCMSFSIPAAEDIGPPTLAEQLDGISEPSDSSAGSPGGLAGPPLTPAGGNSWRAGAAATDASEALSAAKLKRRGSLATGELSPTSRRPNGGGPMAGSGPITHHDLFHLSGEARSPLAGAVGDTSDKRDVISVSQCCNMMETEDVTVNLRCGFNETRRLVFKSAKSCECFFCKHV